MTPTDDSLLYEKEALYLRIEKKLRFFEKAIEKTTLCLREGEAYKDVQHLAELVKAHFHLIKQGLSEITVYDWAKDNQEITIPLEANLTPKEQLEALFIRCQKLKRSIDPLNRHLEFLRKEQQIWLTAREDMEQALSIEEIELIKKRLRISPIAKKEENKRIEVSSPYREFYSASGFQILVGKNSDSNHLLTFQIAHGSDLWLHAHSVSGSHVVIKKKKALEIDQETIQDALQLALYFSKARAQAHHGHEVTVTERKYVSRLKNAPKGKVMVSKQKIMVALLDKTRVETIRKRSGS